MPTRFGYSSEVWDKAKQEATDAMVRRARLRGMIPYSELASEINAIKFHPHNTAFHNMLGEISIEEHDAGRGMLSVIFVHKYGDMQPGPGFFELAESLGHKTKDLLEFWVSELRKVHGYWST